ncbi:hypothetical protein TGMAS_414990 [Toxoplasma gondii MAS]|uniref:Uncharacterized protein n=1 Tax=Toxoplasma gondii MAS TaxID=943118 RepID=A0A086QGG3_TOXGO|nr:hypothetical protein TGMAS_414990 [Toxoplasma gondii MAS]
MRRKKKRGRTAGRDMRAEVWWHEPENMVRKGRRERTKERPSEKLEGHAENSESDRPSKTKKAPCTGKHKNCDEKKQDGQKKSGAKLKSLDRWKEKESHFRQRGRTR